MIVFYLFLLFIFLLCLNFAWDRWLRPHLHDDKMEGMVEDAAESYSLTKLAKTLKEKLK